MKRVKKGPVRWCQSAAVSQDLRFMLPTMILKGMNEKIPLNLLPTDWLPTWPQTAGVSDSFVSVFFQPKVLLVSFYWILVNAFCCFPGRAWQERRCWLQRRWRPTWTWSQFHGTHTCTAYSHSNTPAWRDPSVFNMLHITRRMFPVWLFHSSSRDQKDREESKDLLETEAQWAQRLVWGADVFFTPFFCLLSTYVCVSVCDTEREREGYKCAYSLFFQGEVGIPGNGTAGCPGFQVCDSALDSMIR